MISAALTGFFTGFSLILAIGAQNAFVLRQGLARAHVFWICLFCAVSDAILVTVGVAGFGFLVTAMPNLPLYMAWFGAAFLIAYGCLRLLAAYKGEYEAELSGKPLPLWTAIGTVAAFTWLNPHVYLDTVVLIGAISTDYIGVDRVAFGIAAVSSSFVFFFSLGYGARLLAPFFQRADAWRILDVIIALVMFAIAAKLLLN